MSNQQHNNNNNRHRPPRGQQQPQAGMGYAGGMMPPMYQQQYMMQAAARGPDGQPRIQHNQEGQVPMAASGVPPRGYNPQYNPYMFNQAQYMSSQRPNGVPGAAPPIGDQQQQNSSTSSTNTGTGDKNGSRIANTNSPGFGPVRNGVPMGNMGMPGQAVPGIPMQYQQAAFNRPYMMYSNMPRGMMAANMGVQQQQKQQQTPIAPRKKKILEIVDPTTKQKIELPAQDSKKKSCYCTSITSSRKNSCWIICCYFC